MGWGQLVGPAIRVFLMWMRNRFDPEMIKMREISRLKELKEDDIEKVENAIVNDDCVALAGLLRDL